MRGRKSLRAHTPDADGPHPPPATQIRNPRGWAVLGCVASAVCGGIQVRLAPATLLSPRVRSDTPFACLLGADKRRAPEPDPTSHLTRLAPPAPQPAFAFLFVSMIEAFYRPPDQVMGAASFYAWMFFVIACGILAASWLQQGAFAIMGQVGGGGRASRRQRGPCGRKAAPGKAGSGELAPPIAPLRRWFHPPAC